MQKQYRCNAYILPELAFLALRGPQLTGAIALSFGAGGKLPIERTYILDYGTFPEAFELSKTVQLGRWVTTKPHVSAALLCAAVGYAEKHGCEWGIGEMKPSVVRRFRRMGINVARIPGEPDLKNIPHDILPYYLLPPAPIVGLVVLREVEQALVKQVRSLSAQNLIAIQE